MSKYLHLLNDVVNIKPRSKKDVAIAYMGSGIFQRAKINQLIKLHNEFDAVNKNAPEIINVEPYSGNNLFVLQLKSYLNTHIPAEVFGCYVHGSLGTYDNVTYSDFDALVILNDKVFEDKNRLLITLKHLLHAQKFFFEFDPLQHHGWFVMSERILRNYPLLFFPPELFSHAKSLFDNGREFQIQCKGNIDFKKPLLNLLYAIEKSLKKDVSNYNIFQLKSLLSEFMLIPAFYMQAKTKTGIYKKFSFNESAKDFSKEQWQVMDDVSHIRNVWSVDLSDGERVKLSGIGYRNRKYTKENSPKLNSAIKKLITTKLIDDMKVFLKQVSAKANEI